METKKSTAVAVRGAALPITSVADLQSIGQAIAQSGMFGINNPGAGLVVVATCQAQGISLLEFQRTYHMIENKPTMKSDAMLAEFRKHGGKYKIVENSLTQAVADFEFEGEKYRGSFTMDDAKRTGDALKPDGKTLKHNWQHRSDDMLWARMVSRSVRRLCPEIVAGIYTPEEVQDFDTDGVPAGARKVTAIPVEEAQRRAAGGAVPSSVPVTVEVQAVDFDLCPIDCDLHGHKWEEFTLEQLEAAWDNPAVQEGHRDAIIRVVESRKDAAK